MNTTEKKKKTMKSKQVNIVIHPTDSPDDQENTNRIEYRNYVIQLLAQEYSLWSCVIDPNGDDVIYETKCLLDAISWIDADIKKRNSNKPKDTL